MNTEAEYGGYLNTNFLFTNLQELPFEIFNETPIPSSTIPQNINTNLRLGNRVEQYAFHQLKENGFNFLAKNLQIIANKTTLGELDCIVTKNDHILHLEIVCKFYLYDKTVGLSELDHWIGPNRKDSLVEKINKLQQRQLPLLHNEQTISVLKDLNISHPSQQKVFFKGQLFVPYLDKDVRFQSINSNCVMGFYISLKDIDPLKNNRFYIPAKEEWLATPNSKVTWINFQELTLQLKPLHHNEKSPMCWMLNENNDLEKIFITWW